ncbi:unnamed protein product, partial [Porites lobata]
LASTTALRYYDTHLLVTLKIDFNLFKGPKLPEPQLPKPTALMANPIKNKNANAGLEQYKQLPSNVEVKIAMVNDNVNAVIRNQQDLANFMSQMFEDRRSQGGLDNSQSHSANVFRADDPRLEPRVLHELTKNKMAEDAESDIAIRFVDENDYREISATAVSSRRKLKKNRPSSLV